LFIQLALENLAIIAKITIDFAKLAIDSFNYSSNREAMSF
jgi:hypothetical protein